MKLTIRLFRNHHLYYWILPEEAPVIFAPISKHQNIEYLKEVLDRISEVSQGKKAYYEWDVSDLLGLEIEKEITQIASSEPEFSTKPTIPTQDLTDFIKYWIKTLSSKTKPEYLIPNIKKLLKKAYKDCSTGKECTAKFITEDGTEFILDISEANKSLTPDEVLLKVTYMNIHNDLVNLISDPI
jgi:hypothetical protein